MSKNNADKLQIVKILTIGAITGLCNGLFGAGGGIIAVPSMVHFLKLSEHDAHATAISIILPLALISSFIYYRNGFLDIQMIYRVAAGEVIGAIAGAWIMHRISSLLLRKVFAVFIIAAAVRMII